jgi:hypothetical protein
MVLNKIQMVNKQVQKATCCESFDLKASLRISTALDGSTYFLLVPTRSAKRYLSSRIKGKFRCSYRKNKLKLTKFLLVSRYSS